MWRQKIMEELQDIPEEKLVEIYELVHNIRLSLNPESSPTQTEQRTPGLLTGHLGDAFFEPLPEEELQLWE